MIRRDFPKQYHGPRYKQGVSKQENNPISTIKTENDETCPSNAGIIVKKEDYDDICTLSDGVVQVGLPQAENLELGVGQCEPTESNYGIITEETPEDTPFSPEFVSVECTDLPDLVLLNEDNDTDDQLSLEATSKVKLPECLSVVTLLRTHIKSITEREVEKIKKTIDSDKPANDDSKTDHDYPALEVYECSICKSKLPGSDNLFDHLKTHITSKKDLKTFEIVKQRMLTQLKCQLRKTERLQKNCDQCSFVAKYPKNLIRHKLNRHTKEPKPRKKDYQCHICGKDYAGKRNLEIHILAHTNDRKYKCDQCDFSAILPVYVKNHQTLHSDVKNFKCDQCDYRSRRAPALRLHIMRTHTEDRPYKCTWCDYATTNSHHLKVHTRKHTGDKPYKCNVCEGAFAKLWHLKTHMHQHTGERPCKCQYCDYSGVQSSALKSHMRTHHKDRL